MNAFGILSPATLLLIGFIALFGIFLSSAEGRRKRLLRALGLQGNSHSVVPPLLIVAAVSIGLFRPYLGFKDTTIQGVGEDIIAVVDVSRSMLARDASPNRLAVAKRKITDLLDTLTREGRGDRFGIVLFAGDAYSFLPLTADYGVARSFIGAISPELIPSGGSALGAALKLVAETIERTGSPTPRILLLSDGEERSLKPEDVGAALSRGGIGVFAIGIGSREGHPIDIGGGEFLKDGHGAIVVSRLEESGLQRIAEITGGTYQPVALGDEDIQRFLASGGKRFTSGTTTIRSYNEFGSFLAAGALLILTMQLLGSRVLKRGAPLALAVLLLTSPLAAQSSPPSSASPFDGAQRYSRGDFAGATAAFKGALERAPDRWDLNQALGAARYKEKDYRGALEAYSGALEQAQNGRERFESLYSRGNANVLAGRFKEAVTDYDSALTIKPNDAATEYNRAIAQKLLREQQQARNEERKEEKKEPAAPREEERSKEGGEESKEEQEHSEGDSDDRSGESEEASEKDQPAESPSPAPEIPPSSQGEKGSSESSPPHSPPPTTPFAEPSPLPTEAEAGDENNTNPESLREEEAKSWLQSLDEAPVLLQQRPRRRTQRGEQTW